MNIGKSIAGLAIGVVVVVAAIVIFGLSNINQLIKTAVETVGSEVTQTSVTLNSADLSLSEGRGELVGLVVNNPAGYESDYAFSMERIAINVDTRSLTEPVIVIKEIVIDGAAIIAEIKENTDSNLQDILDKISAGGNSKPSANDQAANSSENVKLMVERLRFINGSARVIAAQFGEKTLSIPAIEINDVGDKKTGLSPAQLTQALIKPIIAKAKAQVNAELKAQLKEEGERRLKEKLSEKLSDEDKQKVDKLKSFFGK